MKNTFKITCDNPKDFVLGSKLKITLLRHKVIPGYSVLDGETLRQCEEFVETEKEVLVDCVTHNPMVVINNFLDDVKSELNPYGI